MSGILPKDKIQECKKVFYTFSQGQPFLKRNELREALQALGADPDEGELEKIWDDIDVDKSGEIDLNEFLELFAKKMKDPDMIDDLYEAFKNFDIFNTGYISIVELRRVMTTYGNKMSNIEFDDFISIYLRDMKKAKDNKMKTENTKNINFTEEDEEINPEFENENYVNIKKFVRILVK